MNQKSYIKAMDDLIQAEFEQTQALDRLESARIRVSEAVDKVAKARKDREKALLDAYQGLLFDRSGVN